MPMVPLCGGIMPQVGQAGKGILTVREGWLLRSMLY
jgi:hypothetical protein